MRFFRGKAPMQAEVDSQQERLRKLSGQVLERYRRELKAEISDPSRLAAVYGAGFASAGVVAQAQTVAQMATKMLKVPNAAVNVVREDALTSVALVMDYQVQSQQLRLELDDSACQHVIHTGRELSIADTVQHPLVCDSRLTKEGSMISYLGVPVASPEAIIVGTLCVFDENERHWSTADVGMLTQLSMVITRALPSGPPVTKR